MLNVSLNDFLKLPDVRFVNVPSEKFNIKHIKGISIDSRTIEPDQVFWAIKGESYDGHEFVREANSKSAFCCVIDEKHLPRLKDDDIPLIVVTDTLDALQKLAHIQRQKYNIPVIAITGSNGKTTTKEMVAHVLQKKMNIHKTIGNLNNQIGCPLTMLLLDQQHKAAVLELGTSRFGEIEILTKMTEPNHALITMISDSHLEFLRDRAGVAREKMNLFDNLNTGATVYKNLDDSLIEKYNRADLKYVTYSFNHPADVQGVYGPLDEQGCGSLTINNRFEIKLQVPGIHNVRNALAAAAVTLNLGLTDQEIAEGLGSYKGFDKRMQIVKWKGVTIVNDAYNASPASTLLAIETVQKIKRSGRLFLALGDMKELGKDSLSMHKDILEHALNPGTHKVFVLGEHMQQASNEIKDKGSEKIIVCKNLDEMASVLAHELSENDILLIKGSRGMQMEKILAFLP